MLDWIRFIVGAVVLLLGLAAFALEVFGSYRFSFVVCVPGGFPSDRQAGNYHGRGSGAVL